MYKTLQLKEPWQLRSLFGAKRQKVTQHTVIRANYLPAGPIIASIVPAATAVPITPATLGPMACINKKLLGLAF